MKKIISFMLVVVLLIGTLNVFADKFGTTAIGVNTDATYGLYPLENKTLATRLSGAIAMRTYNTHAYFFGYLDKLDYGSEFLTPYRDGNNDIFVPIAVIANKFGATNVVEEDGNLTFNYSGRDYTLKANDVPTGFESAIQLYEKRLCAKAEDLATFLGKELLVYKDLIIYSDVKDIIDTKREVGLLKKLEEFLLYTVKQVYLQGQGFITDVKYNPLDGLMYAVTDVGGCYRYEPEAHMWVQLFDWVEQYHYEWNWPSGLGLDTQDENRIYVGTNKGLLKSDDKGKTWSSANLNAFWDQDHMERYSGDNIVVDPVNNNIIFAGADDGWGLWRSEDRSDTWTQVATVPSAIVDSGEDGVRCIWFDEESEVVNGRTQVIYASSNGHGLYKSSDGGNTFTLIEGSPKYIRRQIKWRGGWLITSSEGLYYLKDNKIENVTPSICGTDDFCAITVHPENDNYIVMCSRPFDRSGLYYTLDGCATWNKAPDTSIATPNWSDCIFDPYNPDTVLYMTGSGAYRFMNLLTGDETQFYSYRDCYGIEELCMRGVYNVPQEKDGQKTLFMNFMDYGAAAHGLDYLQPHQTLTFIGAEGSGFDFCESDPSIIVRGGTSGIGTTSTGRVMYSTDYGDTWTEMGGWDKNEQPAAVAVSATKQENGIPVIMVYCVYSNNVYRSEDFGKTFEKIEIDGFNANMGGTSFWTQASGALVSDRVKGNIFYLTTPNKFYRSTDFGKTWKIRSNFTGARMEMRTQFGTAEKIWHPRSTGMFYSDDGGMTWNKVKGFTNAYNVSLGKNSADVDYPIVYVLGIYNNDEGVFASRDNGKTWTKISYAMSGWGGLGTASVAGDRNVEGRVFVCQFDKGVRVLEMCGTDTRQPVITVDQVSTSDVRDANFATTQQQFTISGKVNKTAEVRINNETLPYSSDGSFEKTYTLALGENSFRIEAVDRTGNKAEPVYINRYYDPNYIGMTINADETYTTNVKEGSITGKVNKNATVYVNDSPVYPDENLNFTINYTLSDGENVLNVYATDGTYKSDVRKFEFIYDHTAPVVTVGELPTTTDDTFFVFNATPDEDATLRINRMTLDVKGGTTLSTFLSLEAGENSFIIQGKDKIGNISAPQTFTIVSTGKNAVNTTLEVEYVDSMEFTGNIEKDFGELPYIMPKLMDGTTSNLCYFGLRWNEENLYIGVRVNDDKLFSDLSNVYENDTVEVYLDGGYERAASYDANDRQIFFPWNGGGQTGGTTMKYVTTSYGYDMEIAIPWSLVKTTVTAGQKVGFDIDVCDNDGLGQRSGVIGFAGTGSDWCDTTEFATLILKAMEDN